MAQSRIEAILENILGADNEILAPVSRNENLLLQVANLIEEGTAGEVIDSEEITEIIDTIS